MPLRLAPLVLLLVPPLEREEAEVEAEVEPGEEGREEEEACLLLCFSFIGECARVGSKERR
jgi:hypothetical protein